MAYYLTLGIGAWLVFGVPQVQNIWQQAPSPQAAMGFLIGHISFVLFLVIFYGASVCWLISGATVRDAVKNATNAKWVPLLWGRTEIGVATVFLVTGGWLFFSPLSALGGVEWHYPLTGVFFQDLTTTCCLVACWLIGAVIVSKFFRLNTRQFRVMYSGRIVIWMIAAGLIGELLWFWS